MTSLEKQIEEKVKEIIAEELEKIGWEIYHKNVEPLVRELEERVRQLEKQLQT